MAATQLFDGLPRQVTISHQRAFLAYGSPAPREPGSGVEGKRGEPALIGASPTLAPWSGSPSQ